MAYQVRAPRSLTVSYFSDHCVVISNSYCPSHTQIGLCALRLGIPLKDELVMERNMFEQNEVSELQGLSTAPDISLSDFCEFVNTVSGYRQERGFQRSDYRLCKVSDLLKAFSYLIPHKGTLKFTLTLRRTKGKFSSKTCLPALPSIVWIRMRSTSMDT